MDIPLSNIYPIAAPEKYKVHLACWNGSDQPLDVFFFAAATSGTIGTAGEQLETTLTAISSSR